MLKNIDPLLSPELLSTLRAMGHGDELAIVDANFPAASSGPPVMRADGSPVTAVAAAVLSLMPLDEFVPCAAFHMQVVDNPATQMPIFEEFRALLRKYEPGMAKLEGIDGRHADFRGANLQRAVFKGANMSGANLTGAKLEGIDLSNANLLGTLRPR